MRRVSSPRRPGPVSALLGLALAAGCTHNHYYYEGAPAYVVPGEAVVVDEVCELPSRVFSDAGTPSLAADSSKVASAPSDADVFTSSSSGPGSGASRVVISRPSSGPIASRGWSARDRSVTTQTQGGADLSRLQ